jgi:hypothetical protein
MTISLICFVNAVNGDGLFGTVGTRSIDATTSAGVKSLPSKLDAAPQLEFPRQWVDRLPFGSEPV